MHATPRMVCSRCEVGTSEIVVDNRLALRTECMQSLGFLLLAGRESNSKLVTYESILSVYFFLEFGFLMAESNLWIASPKRSSFSVSASLCAPV